MSEIFHDEQLKFHDDVETLLANNRPSITSVDAIILPFTNWGKYQLEKFISEGGMGRVYQATDLRLKRAVALLEREYRSTLLKLE